MRYTKNKNSQVLNEYLHLEEIINYLDDLRHEVTKTTDELLVRADHVWDKLTQEEIDFLNNRE